MRKVYWFLIFIILFAVVTFVVYYNVAKVGITLRAHHEYIEYAFYALCGILYFALIVDPLVTILFKDRYSVAEIAAGKPADYGMVKSLYKNLIKNGDLHPGQVRELKQIYSTKKERSLRLNKKLYLLYNSSVSKSIDNLVVDTAKNTFYITAISQNGFVDMLTVLVNNFRMIKRIVALCGFRPSFLRLMKLYINIFAASLIADGAQELNLTSLLGSSIAGGLKVVINSVANGTLNAFFMLRTGFLAKQYLFSMEVDNKKAELRTTAMAEAAARLPQIVTSVISDPIKGLGKMLFKGNTADAPKDADEDIKVDLNQKWFRKK